MRGAQVPPDLGGILDRAGANDGVYGPVIAGKAFQPGRQAGAGEVVEDGEAIAAKAGILALPER